MSMWFEALVLTPLLSAAAQHAKRLQGNAAEQAAQLAALRRQAARLQAAARDREQQLERCVVRRCPDDLSSMLCQCLPRVDGLLLAIGVRRLPLDSFTYPRQLDVHWRSPKSPLCDPSWLQLIEDALALAR